MAMLVTVSHTLTYDCDHPNEHVGRDGDVYNRVEQGQAVESTPAARPTSIRDGEKEEQAGGQHDEPEGQKPLVVRQSQDGVVLALVRVHLLGHLVVRAAQRLLLCRQPRTELVTDG